MVSSVIDVSGWQLKVQWAARQQSAEEIADLALQSCDRFVRAFPEFEGAWKVSSEVGSVEYRDNAVPELVRSSLLRVDGEPDPARGFSFLLLSPVMDGSYAAIRVRAGATHQTRRVAPNSVSLDFSSVDFGEPVTLRTSGPGFEAFVDLAKSLEVLWEAESMKVADRAPEDLLGE
ncbi:hypothetical protein [Curtobacterium sp. L1-20]|uniref:hypothetical protein n=1 Tax=Curtobacterium sp. L1-20 TaxID=3138181 RepID=UPI003B52B902